MFCKKFLFFWHWEKGQSSMTKWICSLKLFYQHVAQTGFLPFLTYPCPLVRLYGAVKQIQIK